MYMEELSVEFGKLERVFVCEQRSLCESGTIQDILNSSERCFFDVNWGIYQLICFCQIITEVVSYGVIEFGMI